MDLNCYHWIGILSYRYMLNYLVNIITTNLVSISDVYAILVLSVQRCLAAELLVRFQFILLTQLIAIEELLGLSTFYSYTLAFLSSCIVQSNLRVG